MIDSCNNSDAPRPDRLGGLVLRLRLVSGLVLLVYVAMHLTNLAFGLQSIAAMEAARELLLKPWTGMPGTLLLGGAALIHCGLGLMAIAARRSLTLSRTDWVQGALGLATAPLLLNHVLLLKFLPFLDGEFKPNYALVLSGSWRLALGYALQQVLVVVIVWIHASIGLHSWLVLKPYWPRVGPLVLPLLFVVPILSLLGFVSGGKEALTRLDGDPAWQQQISAAMGRAVAAKADLDAIQFWVFLIYGVAALLAFGVLVWRVLRQRGGPTTVRYDGDMTARGRQQLSILEISKLNFIPHAAVCGGRGRCGTCLVSVTSDPDGLSPIGEVEGQTLTRVHATRGQRLACQAHVCAPAISVIRLRPAYADASTARDAALLDTPPATVLQDAQHG